MKCRIGRGFVVIGLTAITLFLPLLVSPHRIDETHRNLIREGMTAGDVESIFGVPQGNYDWAVPDDAYAYRIKLYYALISLAERQVDARQDQPVVVPVAGMNSRQRRSQISRRETWTSRHGSVTIGFDDGDRVTFIGGWRKVRVEPPWKKWWDKIRGK